jgi:hypothetical protein
MAMGSGKCLDKNEAPDGYLAVLKSSVKTDDLGNICRACDWREECKKEDADFTISKHRCMATPVLLESSGEEVKRADGCSVVFKKDK